MSNSLAIYTQMEAMTLAARALQASGYFSDVKSEAQALVKVMAGAEIGLPPFAAMTGIHIVQGKPVIGANLIATLVKNDPRYDYRVKQADATACIIQWYESGQAVGESSFTMTEATAAGLTGKDNWKKYTSDMLFARALTRGARRYAPGISGGSPIYTPDELGVDTDADGHIVEGHIVQAEPAPAIAAPMPDDDLVIHEASAREFIAVAAGLLDTDAEDLKERLKALGYTGIPGKPNERVNAYHALKAAPFTKSSREKESAAATQDGLSDIASGALGDGIFRYIG